MSGRSGTLRYCQAGLALLAVTVPAAGCARAASAPSAAAPAVTQTRAQASLPAPAGTAPAAVPAAGLGQVRWVTYQGITVPVSPAGPRETAGGLARGYARTPGGAVMAAVNITLRAQAEWGPRVFTPVIQDQFTGPARAALLAATRAAYQQARAAQQVADGDSLGMVTAAQVAYRVTAYTPDTAAVTVVTAFPGQAGGVGYAATALHLAWAPGGWKIIAPPGGNWAPLVTAVTSLASYAVFPGAPQ